MRRTTRFSLCTWLLACLLGQAARTQAEAPAQVNPSRTFAQFDEVYIPALALTNQGKANPSRLAFRRFSELWTKIRPEILQTLASDPAWKREMEKVDEIVQVAGRQIKAGQLAEAHETLEPIRDLMMEARRRQGVVYPIDSLSDFHATMEAIVKPAMQWTPEKVSSEELARLRELVVEADTKWTVAERTDFNLQDFGIEPSEAKQLRQLIDGERQAIAALQSAISSGDKPKIIQAARGLKPPFAKTYMFFGDFPEPRQP